jgi:hypothetical protein
MQSVIVFTSLRLRISIRSHLCFFLLWLACNYVSDGKVLFTLKKPDERVKSEYVFFRYDFIVLPLAPFVVGNLVRMWLCWRDKKFIEEVERESTRTYAERMADWEARERQLRERQPPVWRRYVILLALIAVIICRPVLSVWEQFGQQMTVASNATNGQTEG